MRSARHAITENQAFSTQRGFCSRRETRKRREWCPKEGHLRERERERAAIRPKPNSIVPGGRRKGRGSLRERVELPDLQHGELVVSDELPETPEDVVNNTSWHGSFGEGAQVASEEAQGPQEHSQTNRSGTNWIHRETKKIETKVETSDSGKRLSEWRTRRSRDSEWN